MKKLLLLVLLFALVACGAPEADPEIIEVEKIVEVAAEPEIVEVEKIVEIEVEKIVEVMVTTTPLPEKPQTEFGVLYFQLKQSTRLWELLGEDANGDLVFKRYEPELRFDAGEIVIVYNGRGKGSVAEFYLNADGTLALGVASFPNAQDFYCDTSYTSDHLYADWVAAGKLNACEDGDEPEAASPGLWVGKWVDAENTVRADDRYFYKVAGVGYETASKIAGLYVMAEHGFLPSCETDPDTGELIYLKLNQPESCQQ